MKVSAELAIGVLAAAALGYYLYEEASSAVRSAVNAPGNALSSVENTISSWWDDLFPTGFFGDNAASSSTPADFDGGFGGSMDPTAGVSGDW